MNEWMNEGKDFKAMMPYLSRYLGHTSVDETQIYAKPSLTMMRKALESVQSPQTTNEKPLWVGSEEKMAQLCGLR